MRGPDSTVAKELVSVQVAPLAHPFDVEPELAVVSAVVVRLDPPFRRSALGADRGPLKATAFQRPADCGVRPPARGVLYALGSGQLPQALLHLGSLTVRAIRFAAVARSVAFALLNLHLGARMVRAGVLASMRAPRVAPDRRDPLGACPVSLRRRFAAVAMARLARRAKNARLIRFAVELARGLVDAALRAAPQFAGGAIVHA